MTEIQWLVDVMLHHKLPGPVKDKFIARIGEVETLLNQQPKVLVQRSSGVNIPGYQAPSTQKILDEMNQSLENINKHDNSSGIPTIAQTQATANALHQRAEAIKIATSGKPEAGRTSPRKF
jgi:hypothetical protein